MIISKEIEIPKKSDNIEIEAYLHELGIVPLRWAIVEVQDKIYRLNVSYELKNE